MISFSIILINFNKYDKFFNKYDKFLISMISFFNKFDKFFQ